MIQDPIIVTYQILIVTPWLRPKSGFKVGTKILAKIFNLPSPSYSLRPGPNIFKLLEHLLHLHFIANIN